MATVPLMILDQATLVQILKRRPDVVREFTFLSGPAAKVKNLKTGCGACRQKNAVAMEEVEAARKKLANMPPDRKTKLKEMLQVKNIRIFYKNDANQSVKDTI